MADINDTFGEEIQIVTTALVHLGLNNLCTWPPVVTVVANSKKSSRLVYSGNNVFVFRNDAVESRDLICRPFSVGMTDCCNV